MTDWPLRDARLDGPERLDLPITDGRIAENGPALEAPAGCPTRDLGGRAVVRGFVEARVQPAPRCAIFKGGRLLVERQTTTRCSLGPSEAHA